MKSLNYIAFIAILMIFGCLSAPGQNNTQNNKETVSHSAAVVPLVDHHKHLFSPNIAERDRNPFLPAIQVPADLARLLSERTVRFNDPKTIGDLYTENAILNDSRVTAWFQGRSKIANFIISRFRASYEIMPVSYSADGSRGYIAGYITRGGNRLAHVHLSVEKGADGFWRIAAESIGFPTPYEGDPPVTAERVVKELDEAGIKKAVVLSVAYQWGNPDKMRAENNWVAEQSALYPDRLIPFFSFNPLTEYGLEELERCAKNPRFKGIKLHFGSSRVDIRKPEHAEKLRQVFRAANKHRLPIIVHLWRIGDYEEKGNEDAKVFLEKILPEAPDITIQIAHMAGGGRITESALAVFADAIAAKDPRTKNLYFDVTTMVDASSPAPRLRRDADWLRKIGLERILWGSDQSFDNPTGKQWLFFRALMPLTEAELKQIANNVAPYLR
ncbi:MAG TPA: amidohydrolase family protein [Pyrinomonadaceae bacterium]|jgi:predicted TIM-barrel fold metal-dependent hydrolase